MKRKLNLQVLTEKHQLKDIAWAKKQKKHKKVKRKKRSSRTHMRLQK
jgi:hypothetical protein